MKLGNFYLQIPGTVIIIGGFVMRIRLLVLCKEERCVQIGILDDPPLLQRSVD